MNKNVSDATEELKLCEIADICLGHPFRGAIKAFANGDAYVIQVRDTEANGEIRLDEMIKTNFITKKQPDWLQNGDVLFVAKGSKHYSALVEGIQERTLCSPDFFVVRLNSRFKELVLPEFLCWQLNQQPAQRYFKATAEGSLYLSIRRQVLENVPIKILPLEKQRQLSALNHCFVKEQKVLQQLIQNRQHQLEGIAKMVLESNSNNS